ncbi:hypothetical protein [Streptomyces sp. XD-27]|uniref:hypothetical protein n=1 Tax=Streptomyces sp. XD-27 TaxID=3062779 RepID=UPI0026F45CBF|nr:hypothetical protein [Streptomyces sp. XD-27]WKX71243.1 hypothetical protein Q3Y56_16225 [Streptomyces sp. XD-27]
MAHGTWRAVKRTLDHVIALLSPRARRCRHETAPPPAYDTPPVMWAGHGYPTAAPYAEAA